MWLFQHCIPSIYTQSHYIYSSCRFIIRLKVLRDFLFCSISQTNNLTVTCMHLTKILI